MRLIHTVKTDFFIVGGGYNSFTVSSFLVYFIAKNCSFKPYKAHFCNFLQNFACFCHFMGQIPPKIKKGHAYLDRAFQDLLFEVLHD